MDTWKYYGITHADHLVCNPTSGERLDELVTTKRELDLQVALGFVFGVGRGDLLGGYSARYHPIHARVGR